MARPPDQHAPAEIDLAYGVHAVEELVRERRRVREVLLEAGCGPAARQVGEEATRLGLRVRVLPSAAFRELARGRPFQGVAARVAPFEYADPDDLIAACARDPGALCLALDSVQDPGNLGSILRTSAFFGVRGVFVPKDRAAPVTAAVVRASAGAADRLPIARVTNLARTLVACRDAGFVAIGAVTRGGVTPTAVPPGGPRVLVLGSEGEGLRRLVRESCDHLVTLDSPGNFESLNVGVAAGVLIHALLAGR